MERQSYFVPDLSQSSSQAMPVHPTTNFEVVNAMRVLGVKANCVGSKLADGSNLHAPTLDIDLPCRLVPSSTPGHFHLYIDKAMTWAQYVRLLNVMADVGILEPNYVAASIRDGATILRRPGVKK